MTFLFRKLRLPADNRKESEVLQAAFGPRTSASSPLLACVSRYDLTAVLLVPVHIRHRHFVYSSSHLTASFPPLFHSVRSSRLFEYLLETSHYSSLWEHDIHLVGRGLYSHGAFILINENKSTQEFQRAVSALGIIQKSEVAESECVCWGVFSLGVQRKLFLSG